jgi:co-chaperonin GroES (HSP10)
MSVRFKPMGDGVLIAPVIPPKETISPAGIVTTVNTPELPTRGDIVITGEEVKYTTKGDTVLFGIHAGKDVEVDGVVYKLIKEGNLDGFFLD